jgi:hypothetical protein
MVPPSSLLSSLEPLLEELCLAARASASAAVAVAAVAVFLGTRAKKLEHGAWGRALVDAHEELDHKLEQCKCRARVFGFVVRVEAKTCTPSRETEQFTVQVTVTTYTHIKGKMT